eukprot:12644721-Alexandrium_andersonii.AAC.1
MLAYRGVGSVALSKIKAHQTEQQARQSGTPLRDWHGNAVADACAARGAELSGEVQRHIGE